MVVASGLHPDGRPFDPDRAYSISLSRGKEWNDLGDFRLVKKAIIKHNCAKCGRKQTRATKTGLCRTCRRVSERPSEEEIIKLVKKLGWSGAARNFGISDNALRKWVMKKIDGKWIFPLDAQVREQA